MEELLARLDSLADVVKLAIPDAEHVMVGRERTSTLDYMWVIEFYLPRRNQAYRVLKNGVLHRISGHDSTSFEKALEMAVEGACWYRTGKFPE